MSTVRIYFATDVHASERWWKKFLSAPQFYGATVAIRGGDITGKVIVPLLCQHDGTTRATFNGIQRTAQTDTEPPDPPGKLVQSHNRAARSPPREHCRSRTSTEPIDALGMPSLRAAGRAMQGHRLGAPSTWYSPRCGVCPPAAGGDPDAHAIPLPSASALTTGLRDKRSSGSASSLTCPSSTIRSPGTQGQASSKAAGSGRRQTLFVAMGALRTAGPCPDRSHVSHLR